MLIVLGWGLGLTCLLVVGCRSAPRGFASPEPGERVFAVTDAARTRDPDSIPHLIALLRSDDPLVRMTSSRTLELLTGQTLGYHHAASEPQREQAIQRWAEWYHQRSGAAGSMPEERSDTDLRF